MCEDLEDRESLHLMYRLVRGLVLLNDASLFDELLSEENVMDVVGALEYEYVGEELAREQEDGAAKRAEQEGAAAGPGAESGEDGARNDERAKSGGEATTDAGKQGTSPETPNRRSRGLRYRLPLNTGRSCATPWCSNRWCRSRILPSARRSIRRTASGTSRT